MKVEVFYDLTCPYCYKGLNELSTLLSSYPHVEFDWIPCEAHPRPEYAPVHADLAAQVVFFLKEKKLDVPAFNTLVFEAHFEKGERIDDINLLSLLASTVGANKDEVSLALSENRYATHVHAANIACWQTNAFEAVPSYVYGDSLAMSSGGLLVDKAILEGLLKSANANT